MAANLWFQKCKDDLINATRLDFPLDSAPTRDVSDVSDIATGAAIEEWAEGVWKPLPFFSWKFSLTQLQYVTIFVCFFSTITVYLIK